jgi:hypothetical protein
VGVGGLLVPTPEFARWAALSEKLRAAEQAADTAARSLAERRRNRDLVSETLGWRVLDGTGRAIGRVVSLLDVEPEGMAVEMLFDGPSRDELRSGAG